MKESKSITFIDRICKLSHPNLKSYISQRRVDFEVAQDFCKEIHYHINDKHYYAIAFENIDGGMEIRNKYCKRSIGKKTISIIRTMVSHILSVVYLRGYLTCSLMRV